MAAKPIEFYGLRFYNPVIEDYSVLVYDNWGDALVAHEVLSANDDQIDITHVRQTVLSNITDDFELRDFCIQSVCGDISLSRFRIDEDNDGYEYIDTGMDMTGVVRGKETICPVIVYIVNSDADHTFELANF